MISKKKLFFATHLSLTLLFFINIGCRKPNSVVNTIATPPINTAPTAYAGGDAYLTLANPSYTLNGEAYDTDRTTLICLWKKVSGPSSHSIDDPGSITTKVSNLEKGIYQFELLVKDKGGLTGKDTVTINVIETAKPSPEEILLKDYKWNCPMGCWIQVDCLSCLVPAGAVFKIFLKATNSTEWVEVIEEHKWQVTDKYGWMMQNNKIVLFGYDYSLELNHNTQEVKIVY